MIALMPFIGGASIAPTSFVLLRLQRLLSEIGVELREIDFNNAYLLDRLSAVDYWIPAVLILQHIVTSDILQDLVQPLLETHRHLQVVERALPELTPTVRNMRRDLAVPGAVTQNKIVRLASILHFREIARTDWSIEFDCAELGVSRSTLEKAFRLEGYNGVAHARRNTQMTQAMRLVQLSDLPITEVGMAVGYEDLSAFDRAFHRHWNASPREIRKTR